MSKFSIIVPIYKVEKYLDECVQSVLSQSFGDYECVLVDDGSPDNCPAMCDEYKRKYEKVKVIHKENGGLSDARNAGILQASGEYIVLLDSDDKFADKNVLQNLFDVIQEYKTDVVVNVNNFTFTDDGKKELLDRYDKDITIVSSNYIITSFNKALMYMAGCFFVLNREHLIKNDLFFKKGILHEDEHWMPRVICAASRVAVNHNLFYAYRTGRPDSIMSNVSPKRLFDIITIIEDIINWLKAEDIEVFHRQVYVDRGIRLWKKVFRSIALLETEYYQDIVLLLKKLKESAPLLLCNLSVKNYIYYLLIDYINVNYKKYKYCKKIVDLIRNKIICLKFQ